MDWTRIQFRRWQWLAAWPGGAAIGIANGVIREATYGRRLSETTASRLSALTAVLLFAGYFQTLQRHRPIDSGQEAVNIGAAWLALTVSFEFGFGRMVARKTWSELAGEYDIRRGRLWPLVLAEIALGPELARRFASA